MTEFPPQWQPQHPAPGQQLPAPVTGQSLPVLLPPTDQEAWGTDPADGGWEDVYVDPTYQGGPSLLDPLVQDQDEYFSDLSFQESEPQVPATAETQAPPTKAEIEQHFSAWAEALRFGDTVPTPEEFDQIRAWREYIVTKNVPTGKKVAVGNLNGGPVRAGKIEWQDVTEPHYYLPAQEGADQGKVGEELDSNVVSDFLRMYAEMTVLNKLKPQELPNPNSWRLSAQDIAGLEDSLAQIDRGQRPFMPGRAGAIPRGLPRIRGKHRDGTLRMEPYYDEPTYTGYAMTDAEYTMLRQYGTYRRKWLTEDMKATDADYKQKSATLQQELNTALWGVTDPNQIKALRQEFMQSHAIEVQELNSLQQEYMDLSQRISPQGKGLNEGTWIPELAEPRNIEWMRARVTLAKHIQETIDRPLGTPAQPDPQPANAPRGTTDNPRPEQSGATQEQATARKKRVSWAGAKLGAAHFFGLRLAEVAPGQIAQQPPAAEEDDADLLQW